MNALLITPRIYDFTAFNYWFYPLIELLVADYLYKAGYDVTYINGLDYAPPRRNDRYGKSPFTSIVIPKPEVLKSVPRNYHVFGKDINELEREISQAPTPQIAIVFQKMTYWYPGVLECVDLVSKYHPECKVIIGGNITSLLEVFYRNKGIDAQLIGSFDQLKSCIELNTKRAIAEPAITELVPRHELFFKSKGGIFNNPNFFATITTFGCPFKCSYCLNSIKNNRLLYRPVDKIIDELVETMEKFKIKDLAFYDDYVVSNRNIIEVLKNVKRKVPDARFHFPNGLPVSKLIEYLNDFSINSVTTFALGFEFYGNEKSTEKEYIRLFREIDRLEFNRKNIGINVMIGLPGQKYQDAVRTVEFIKKYSPGYRIKLNEYSPVPGTSDARLHIKDSVFDFIEEPLWQNNSLLGYRVDKEFDHSKIKELKILIK